MTAAAPALARRRGLAATAVALAAGLGLFAGGVAAARAARAERAVPSAEIDGVALHLRRAVWLDHEAVDRDPSAHALSPGLPAPGFHRLAVSFTVENLGGSERRFVWQDLVLRWPRRDAFAASQDGRASLALPAGHAALLEASFDVPEGDDALTLWWERGDRPARLLVTRTPAHAGPPRPAPDRWPRLATALPRGRAERGGGLFRTMCASCHGDPAVPGTNGAAPHLGAIGAAAGARVAGQSAPQYLYTSLLEPDAFLAPGCDGPGACPEGVRMPPYGEVLSLQDAADLVAYLLAQRGAP